MRNKKPGFLRNPGEKTGITASSRYALAGIQVVPLEGDGHGGVWSVTLQGVGDIHQTVPGCAGRDSQVGDTGGLRRKKSKT